MTLRTLVLPISLAALLGSAACGSRSTTISTGDGKVTVTEKNKDGASSMTFTGKNGEKVTMDMNAGKVPADYPSDVPVYKDAQVMMAQTISEKNGRNLILETGDAGDKVAAFYKSGIESNGWKIEGTVSTGELTLITATKPGKQLVVQINNAGDKRNIVQTVSDK
jgi:hypothetical protein